MKLSACMIVKDELETLPACLRTLVGYVDEIVIVDTGSTDGTQYLVEAWSKAYDTKFVIEKWTDYETWSFSDARNYSMSKATGDWIFIVDADDRVDVEDWDQLLKWLSSENDALGEYDLIAAEILNVYGHKAQIGTRLRQPRFFRKSSGPKYVGTVHNNITFPDLNRPHNSIKADFKIYHTGYGMLSKEALDAKTERVIRMTKKDTEENPGSAYSWFNLANGLKSRMANSGWNGEDLKEALYACDMAMSCAGSSENHTFINAVTLKGWLHYYAKEYDKADLCASQAIREKADHVDAILLKAYANADQDNLDLSEHWLKQYLIEEEKLQQVGKYDYVACEFVGHKADVYQTLAAIELRRRDVVDRRRALMMK